MADPKVEQKPSTAKAGAGTGNVKPTPQNPEGQTSTTTDQPTKEAFQNDANPAGDQHLSTGLVGTSEVIIGQEHVLGDDPRRIAHKSGYHDSLSGRPVNADGEFTDGQGDGPIPKHRIIADDWPNLRDKGNDASKRVGNEAAKQA